MVAWAKLQQFPPERRARNILFEPGEAPGSVRDVSFLLCKGIKASRAQMREVAIELQDAFYRIIVTHLAAEVFLMPSSTVFV